VKFLCEQDEMSLQAGFGRWAVVWKPWSSVTPVILYVIIIIERFYAWSN